MLTDSTPDIIKIQLEHLRCMPVWYKLALVGEMNQTIRIMAMAGLRQRYPEASSAQLKRHLADLILGKELAVRAYGLHPEKE